MILDGKRIAPLVLALKFNEPIQKKKKTKEKQNRSSKKKNEFQLRKQPITNNLKKYAQLFIFFLFLSLSAFSRMNVCEWVGFGVLNKL